ncbi:DUF1295-domain-containing protein [Lentinula edodes]|uniref:DUF1295-domain-containing protein n=1 Tax=Lentinula edodes TaxID=5353 RepID=A0A1Q3EKT2_LENED|nr:DUF1295-domain-containing protein [Lentinula edodes]
MAVFSKIFPSLATSYIVQAVFALVFVPQRNEKYYDLGGAVGFISTTFASLYYPSLRESVMGDWGHFWSSEYALISRYSLCPDYQRQAFKAGGDSRFDEVKHKPVHFTFYWFMQATWVFIVGLPVYLANTIPKNVHPPMSTRDYLSIGLFAKEMRRSTTKSLLLLVYGALVGIQIMLANPIFTYFLLRKLSGVPPLEKAGDKRFGTDPKWHEYKRTVPIFWPWSSARE